MQRRSFITLLGGAAAAWPMGARAQQTAIPVVGFLHGVRPEGVFADALATFQQGLADGGFFVGQNVALEVRWANLQFAKLPSLAEDLVKSQVAVIFVAPSPGPVLAVKAATTTIPIVFHYGGDPVRDGLVASFSRPGGNLTGLTTLQTDLAAKRLGLLRELIPSAKTIGLLTGTILRQEDREHRNDILAAAQALGLKVVVFEVVWPDPTLLRWVGRTLERAFATFAESVVGGVFVDNYLQLGSNHPAIISLGRAPQNPGHVWQGPIRSEWRLDQLRH